jgi:hypothetical protein
MLKSTPEYVSAYVGGLDNSAPTGLAREALAQRRRRRRQRLSQIVAAFYRASPFGEETVEKPIARKEPRLTPFMDVHNVEGGVSANDVAGAYMNDLESAEDDGTVHREAQGLVADESYPVSEYS